MAQIKIFARNSPYGRLSNTFHEDMVIDDEKYKSVSNFVYSQMLNTPIYRTIIKNATPSRKCVGEESVCEQYNNKKAECLKAGCKFKTESITEQFYELYDKEQYDNLKDAYSVGISHKIDQNSQMVEELLSTESRPIVYSSFDDFLGTGQSNQGQNIYGKLMENERYKLAGIRDSRIKQQNEQEHKDKLYSIYVAYVNLEKLFRNGDALERFIDNEPDEIISKLSSAGVTIMREPKRELVIQEAEKQNYGIGTYQQTWINPNIYMAMKNPKIITDLIRDNLKDLRDNLKNKELMIILNMYMTYLLKKKYPKIPVDQHEYAIRQQLRTTTSEEIKSISEKLKDLYEKGMLSEKLSEKIKRKIVNLKIPSDEDVNAAREKSDALRKSVTIKVTKDMSDDVNISDKPIYIWPEDAPEDAPSLSKLFSPVDDSFLITINRRVYPSIAYYVIATEFARCCVEQKRVGSVSDAAYNMLVDGMGRFIRLHEVQAKLGAMSRESYVQKLKNNVIKALDVKFQNRRNQDVLLSTENADLLYDDRKDSILGSRSPERENFVGKQLMLIRKELRRERKESGEDLADVKDVLSDETIDLVFKNNFLKGWFNMRVRDICNVVVIFKDYIYNKYNNDIKISPELMEQIMDDIYQPCSHIFAASGKIREEPPKDFVRMVESYDGFLDVVTEHDKIIDIMWRRTCVIIYHLLKHLNNSNVGNVEEILKRFENMASTKEKCTEILPNDEQNCIFHALVNILNGLRKVDMEMNMMDALDNPEIEFNASVAILLNISRLAEQQSLQREMFGDRQSIVSGKDIEEIREKLKNRNVDESVVEKIVKTVNETGRVPEDNQLYAMSLAVQQDDSDSDSDSDSDVDEIHDDIFGVPDSDISAKITVSINNMEYAPEDSNDYIYSADHAINFVMSFEMDNKIKRNRTNFFASRQNV